MKLKTSTHLDCYFILPGLRVAYDNFYEGELCFLSIEIFWLKWSLDFIIVDK